MQYVFITLIMSIKPKQDSGVSECVIAPRPNGIRSYKHCSILSDPNMTAQNLLFTYGQGYFVDEWACTNADFYTR